ncbi:MAG TPA: CopG family transcriptional regulator [bacterium]|jgi:metal-responsive CopG/Arc/MetJ family transcriptional regulator
MPSVKTAVSLRAPLLKEIDELAQHLDVPRSQLLARAAEEFLQRYRNQQLLQRINQAYSARPTIEERRRRAGQRRRHRKMLEGQW